jgi:plasmid stability protein
MPVACYGHAMAHIQVKNVPDALLRKIRRCAAAEGRTIRDYVLEALRAKIAREEFADRLARRKPVLLERSAGAILEDVRGERDRERTR